MKRKEHWENVFKTKPLNEVSWYEVVPETSLSFFKESNISKSAKIIDIGGGDSFLVDNLLKLGYKDITVLDISEAALDRAKQRLKGQSKKVKWIVADVADFSPPEHYDFWHDRAAFHFLTELQDINGYIETVQEYLNKNGNLVVATFSENGPKKCSGLEIKQYSESTMTNQFKMYFDKIRCIKIDHKTPFDTNQNFVFCWFRKIT
ncbi:class I SAM-dependent methyltransferase [Sungkyunkwania multivorans]|uniref:Class I SAM-dependent methyltransferase n=1 Tax=Sungkyunkwania multivorans TaxID=1173618 RepID=A0ABW3D1X5_9FLAO|nr:class I SAM-dependent methyltransferase [Aquimarina longa]